MLPKFKIEKYDDRYFVETNWQIDVAPGAYTMLQVTTAGRLDTASAGWSTEAKAKAAIEQCKARLR